MDNPFPRLVMVALQHGFRPPHPGERDTAYLAALIDHVEQDDCAAAHELRVGKPQAQWTADDVQAFRDRMISAHHGPREHLRPGTALAVVDLEIGDATEATLRELADYGLQALVERRIEQPTVTPPIFANVLLTTGHLLTTVVARGDRVAVLKLLAATQPVFGFFLTCDVFIHSIEDQVATKRDALICHVGTRDLRLMKTRPYRVVAGTVVFDDPPPADVDKRSPGPWVTIQDPYASVFVSVPPTGGSPS